MLLTICIPTYNRKELFFYSLYSIVQEFGIYEQVEILVADDGSEEDIYESVQNVSKIFEHEIIYFKHPLNVGIYENFISYTNKSSGDYIWIIGSDDFIVNGSGKIIIHELEKKPFIDLFIVDKYHYKVSMQQLRNFKVETKEILSDYLNFETNKALKEYKVEENFTKDFIHPKYNNVFLGAVMTTIYSKNEMLKGIYKDRNIKVFDQLRYWYPNTYYFANTFLHKKAEFINHKLVIAGDGLQIWSNDLANSIWSSSSTLIWFRVVRDLILNYRINGLNFYTYYLAQNELAEMTGKLYLHILVLGIFTKKLKFPFKDYDFFRITVNSLIYPKFYLGIIKSIIKTLIKKKIY